MSHPKYLSLDVPAQLPCCPSGLRWMGQHALHFLSEHSGLQHVLSGSLREGYAGDGQFAACAAASV